MERFEKLIERLLSRPTDFTWAELQTIMRKFGYAEKKAKGSGRKFINTKTGHVLSLHRPHPGKILKPYARENVSNKLIESGII